nr:unnamed protein product [Digitaria exilis]
MGDQATEAEAAALKLKVMAVPIVSALRLDEEADDFEVLVRVDAPLQAVAKHPPIDLVAAVDRFIIDELHDDDRLAIIAFNQGVNYTRELSPMSGGGRESARQSLNILSPFGGTRFQPALVKAARILERRDEESKGRCVPFIIFLSDGEETDGLGTRWDEVICGDSDHPILQVLRRYPVHTFGFSRYHDPVPLLAIARVSCGTYSYIDHSLDKITDAFAVCLGGLSTVVAVDATITLSAALGVTIVGIDSGGYDKRHIKEDGTSGEVCIPVLYEGEVKNFIVHLRVPRAEAAGEQLLLTAGGTYIDDTAKHGASTTATIVNHHQLSIQRPAGGYDGNDQQRDKAVLEQVIRFRLLSLLEMLPKDTRLNIEGRKWARWLRKKWNELKNSSSLSNNFDKDVEVMVGKLKEGNGQAFVCSYVSSHQTERATTMGSSCRNMIAAGYKTPAITRKAEKATALKPLEAPALRATTAKPHPAPPAPNAGGHIATTTAKPHPAPAANKGGGDGDIAGGIKEKRKESLNMNHHSGSGLPRGIPFHLLEEITNGFSDERKLGSGAFGKVYMIIMLDIYADQGVPKDGEKIAVKMLYDMPGLDEDQFRHEFNNLSRLQHPNIVRLVGYCHEIRKTCVEHHGRVIFADRIRLALCFEYMTFGSLDKYLSDEYSGLDWNVRYAIIKGIYFGLSRFFADERSRITGSHIGTHGYLPPEYIERNIISDKFDIFSLGVVIIKIVTGPKDYKTSAEMTPQELPSMRRLQATPMHLLESYSKQVKKCVEIALSSVVAERHKRPTIGDIVRKLDDDTETDSQILTTSSQATEAEAAAFKLKVMAVPIVSALRLDEEADDFEVLVRVDAPLQAVAKHPPIDLVAAVDTSSSMDWLPDHNRGAVNGEKSRMDYVKAALRFIVDELHDDDRLSIISFNLLIKDRSDLSPMSGGGRESARRFVNRLSPFGYTRFKPALEMAARILEQRDEESKSRRVPFIIFLSGIEETRGWATRKLIKEHGASGEVHIPVLYEGEVKNFIVHLRVPRAEAAGEQLLLTAGGTYIDDTGASTTATIANHHQLSIQRPAGGYDGNDQQCDKAVLEQVIRFRLLSLLEMLPKDRRLNNEGRKWAQWLREKWNELKNSSSLSNNFDKDVEVMVGKLEEGNGQAFVCSYVSSHQTERPTTMGSPCRIMIATPAITRKAEKAAALKPLEAPALRATTAMPHPAPAANKGGGDGDIAGGVKEKRKESLSMNHHSGNGLPRDIPFHLLEEITNGFSDERKLGSGTFGKVYMQGEPKDGEKIAVKMLYDMPGLNEEQFLQEFNNLSRLQHPNIVRLVGYCHEIRKTCIEHNGRMIFADRIHLALCFEYMTFGSLDKYLSGMIELCLYHYLES